MPLSDPALCITLPRRPLILNQQCWAMCLGVFHSALGERECSISFKCGLLVQSMTYSVIHEYCANQHACDPVAHLQPHVRIWDSVSLNTLHVLGLGDFDRAVCCISFSTLVSPSVW